SSPPRVATGFGATPADRARGLPVPLPLYGPTAIAERHYQPNHQNGGSGGGEDVDAPAAEGIRMPGRPTIRKRERAYPSLPDAAFLDADHDGLLRQRRRRPSGCHQRADVTFGVTVGLRPSGVSTHQQPTV